VSSKGNSGTEAEGDPTATATATEADADANANADADADADEERRRRWVIRLLVGLGIGIPVLVEGATFASLVGERLFGGGEDASAPVFTQTPTADRIGIGDELLPSTAPTDTLVDAAITTNGGWTLELTVEVDNATDTGYGLRLGPVYTDDGTSIEGGTSTGRIPPGGSRTVTGTWDLPSSDTPDALELTALTLPENGTTTAVTERVPLAKVPVRR
jgi:hypothetical protein